MQAKRRIKKAIITHISLVDNGANAKTVIWKSGDEPVRSTVVEIRKTDDEQQMVYGIVYAPEQVDNHGDVADAPVIKQMAYDFMKSRYTTNVDKQHNYVPGDGFVAESWLVRKGDALFKDEPAGSWAVGIKIEKAETWEAVKKGEITGISMAGLAELEEVQKADEMEKSLFDKFVTWLGLQKDFNSSIKRKNIREAVYSLESSIEETETDENLDDAGKKQAILASIDQFKNYISNDGNIEKGDAMTPEELQAKVEEAVTKSLQPVTVRLDKLEKAATPEKAEEPDLQKTMQDAVEKALAPVIGRIDALEKSTPGSQLTKGPQDEQKESGGLRLF